MTQRSWLVTLLLGLVGCGGAPLPTDVLAERLTGDEARRARAAAPDLVVQAEQARAESRRAELAGDGDGASELATLSRLLLDAAITEADRAELDRARLVDDARARDAEARAGELDDARLAVVAETTRLQAARAARAEAERALARAAVEESAPRRARRTSTADDDTARDAARILRDRAEATLAAATAMGAPDTAAARDALALAGAQGLAPAEQLARADRALREADRALRAARVHRAASAEAELATLVGEARDATVPLERRSEGVVLSVEGAFEPRATRPSTLGAQRIARLGALLRAHSGAVRVSVCATAPDAASTALARRRADAVVELLGRAGIDRARLTARGAPSRADGEPCVEALVVLGAP